jgi:hypothetical protein
MPNVIEKIDNAVSADQQAFIDKAREQFKEAFEEVFGFKPTQFELNYSRHPYEQVRFEFRDEYKRCVYSFITEISYDTGRPELRLLRGLSWKTITTPRDVL